MKSIKKQGKDSEAEATQKKSFYVKMDREQILKRLKSARKMHFGDDVSFNFGDVLEEGPSYVRLYPEWSHTDFQKRWNGDNKKITAIIDYPFDDLMQVEIPFSYNMMEVMGSYVKEMQKVYDDDKVGYIHGIEELWFEGADLYITKSGKIYLDVAIGS